MKLSKNWKRIIAGFMAATMVFLSVDSGCISALAAEIQEQNNEQMISMEHSSDDLLSLKAIEIEKEELGVIPYDYEELAGRKLFSEEDNSDWEKYSTQYFYNQLDSEWRMVWDSLDIVCLAYLENEGEIYQYPQENPVYFYLDGISLPENTTAEDISLFMELFTNSKPQYYFLDNIYMVSRIDDNYYDSFAVCVYNEFADEEGAKTSINSFNNAVNTAIEGIRTDLDIENKTVSEQEKLLAIHEYVIRMTEYNDAVIKDNEDTVENESVITDEEEQTYFTQSAYSAFCLGTTVCAGYAEAMQLLCNAFDVDAINVTSTDHKWNKVRVYDSWYNVDPTWGDSGNEYAVYYRYYGRSDLFYESDNSSHVMEEFWDSYVPLCVQDSVSQESESNWTPRNFPVPEAYVPTPVINVTKTGTDTYSVAIYNPSEMTTEDSNATIYYTIDNTEPSVASTKSSIYKESFEVTGDYVIKAVAVLDGYWDSEIAEEAKIKTVKNPLINDHFYNKMTLQWDVLDDASGYILDIYKGTEKLPENNIITEVIQDKNTNSYVLDTSTYASGTSIFYEIRAYVGDVANVSEEATSQICKTKSQPLNVDVKWYVTKLDNVDYLVLDVAEILDGNATLQDEMWIWYYSDTSKINPDASFKIDVSDGKTSFMYTYAEHGIAFDKPGYLYVTNEDKTSAFQTDAYAVGGTYVEPELLPIEDKTAQTAGETIVLKAEIAPEKKMENFYYTYQWFVAEDEFATGTAIEGATKDTYQVQIGSFDEKFYYCEVTAEYGTKHIYATSNGISSDSGQQEHTRVSGELFGSEVKISPINDQEYTGSEICPEITIIDLNTNNELIKGKDYTITYDEENTNVKNNVEVTVNFIGDYAKTSTAKVYFNIVPKDVENNTAITVFEVDDVTYSGSAYRPNGEVWDTERNVKLVENVDYKVSFSDNTNAGTASVTLDFIGNYTGTRFINFKILPKDISNESITISNNGSQTYIGYAIVPNLVLEYGNKRLEKGKDFELECSKNVNVGTAEVDIRFIGNYSGSQKTTFTIVQKDASDLIIDEISNQEFTGHAITPSLKIVYSNASGAVELKEGTDYTATYTNNKNQGTATVTLTFKGNYTGTRTKQFQIVARSADNLTCETISDIVYTGEALMPKPVIKNGNLLLEEGTDYDLSYANNINAGVNTAIVTATFKGNYCGTKEIKFTILPKNAIGCEVKLEEPERIYSFIGDYIEPGVIVMDGNRILNECTEENPNADYTVKYTNNRNVGKATITVEFKGNYEGSASLEFSIISKSITAADLVIDGLGDQIYTGNEITPTITIKDKTLEEFLREGIDYIITFIDNIIAGVATIKIEFIEGGNYIGEAIVQYFNIKQRTTENVVISSIPEQRYTGSEIKPEVEVKDTVANILLVKDQDYTVEYQNNKEIGTATVIVSFKGNFTGEPMTTTFTIVDPIPTTITSSVFNINQTSGYISKITVGTTVNTLWSNLNERDYVAIYDKAGNVVTGTTVLGTGMTAGIMDEGTVTKRYTVVVTGDTNGDGKINITDMIAVKACTLKKSGLSGAYEKAGDVNGDGKINITDFIKVKATTLKKDTIVGVAVN